MTREEARELMVLVRDNQDLVAWQLEDKILRTLGKFNLIESLEEDIKRLEMDVDREKDNSASYKDDLLQACRRIERILQGKTLGTYRSDTW